jgi:hypothetical protein
MPLLLFFKGNNFFPKIKVYYAFVVQEMQKNTFFEWIFKKKKLTFKWS